MKTGYENPTWKQDRENEVGINDGVLSSSGAEFEMKLDEWIMVD